MVSLRKQIRGPFAAGPAGCSVSNKDPRCLHAAE